MEFKISERNHNEKMPFCFRKLKKKKLSLYFPLPNVTSCVQGKEGISSVHSASALTPEAFKERRIAM